MDKQERKCVVAIIIGCILVLGFSMTTNYLNKKLLIEHGYIQQQRLGEKGYIWVKK